MPSSFQFQFILFLVATEGSELLLSLTVKIWSSSGAHLLAEDLVGLNTVEGFALHGLVVALNP